MRRPAQGLLAPHPAKEPWQSHAEVFKRPRRSTLRMWTVAQGQLLARVSELERLRRFNRSQEFLKLGRAQVQLLAAGSVTRRECL